MNLEEARGLPRNFTDQHALPERSTSISLGVAGPIKKWSIEFLFAYDVFPHAIMRFDAEWNRLGRSMAIGNVILQRAVIPPVGFGKRMEFAVRVCALIDDGKRVGFAYETLVGHAESGVSEFYFEERNGMVLFTIHTLSQPGHWMARVAKGLFTLPYQAWCTKRALNHVRRRFQSENPQSVPNPDPH